MQRCCGVRGSVASRFSDENLTCRQTDGCVFLHTSIRGYTTLRVTRGSAAMLARRGDVLVRESRPQPGKPGKSSAFPASRPQRLARFAVIQEPKTLYYVFL